MRDAIVSRLSALAAKDPKLILITGDLGFGVLTAFAQKFPKQYLNVGVAEQNMVGVAVGLAMGGRTALVYSIGNFPTLRCLEQIRNDACYHGANVKILAVGGGFSYGALGISHYATEDLSILRALPGITVVAPCSKWEAAEAIEQLVGMNGPAYLRIDKSHAPDDGGPSFSVGKLRKLRHGTDITLIGTGGIVAEVLKGAQSLEARGISTRVYSAHTLKPFDHSELERAIAETRALMTIEEHTLLGGLGSAVAESCMDRSLSPRAFGRLGLPDDFPSIVGSQEFMRRRFNLAAASIESSALRLLGEPVVEPSMKTSRGM